MKKFFVIFFLLFFSKILSSNTIAESYNTEYKLISNYLAVAEGMRDNIWSEDYVAVPEEIPGLNFFLYSKKPLAYCYDANEELYGYKVKNLYIANASSSTIHFDAQNSRLFITTQAIDSTGKWKDIEYSLHSFCGNSYYSIPLKPNTYWKFYINSYEGSFKTKLRVKIEYINQYSPELKQTVKEVIYSNEFEGSINPSQFWNKEPFMAPPPIELN